MNRAPAWRKKTRWYVFVTRVVGFANSGHRLCAEVKLPKASICVSIGRAPALFMHVFEALAHAGRMPRERKQPETSRPLKIQDLRGSTVEQRCQEKLK